MAKLKIPNWNGKASYSRVKKRMRVTYRLPGETEFVKYYCKHFFADEIEKHKAIREGYIKHITKGLLAGGVFEVKTTEQVDQQAIRVASDDITVSELVREYLDACEKGISGEEDWAPKAASTLETQTRRVVEQFRIHVGGSRKIASLLKIDVADFVCGVILKEKCDRSCCNGRRAENGGKKETKQRRANPIRNMLTFAVFKTWLSKNPCERIKFRREKGEKPPKKKKPYSKKDQASLFEVAKSFPAPFMEDVCYFAHYLAMRRGDMVIGDWEHWDWDNLIVNVRRQKTQHSSEVEITPIPMSPQLYRRFKHKKGAKGAIITYTRIKGTGATKILWPTHENLKRLANENGNTGAARLLSTQHDVEITEAAVRKRLKRKIKLTQEAENRKHLLTALSKHMRSISEEAGVYAPEDRALHRWRHTFAVETLQAGIAPAHVARMMGDSWRTVEENYAQYYPTSTDGGNTNIFGLKLDDLDQDGSDEAVAV
ncbi:MAG: site-specific integrase [Planctomycetes bacterium]|nr:site-specific integrase [Planctomycetota bacterium]